MRVTTLFGVFVLALVAAPAGAADKDKLDPAKLVGHWTYVSGENDGQKIDPERLKNGSVDITKDTITLNTDQGKFEIKYELDNTKNPYRIKMEITKAPMGEGSKADGIIELKDGQLKICYAAMGGETPKTFATKEGSGLHLFVLKKK